MRKFTCTCFAAALLLTACSNNNETTEAAADSLSAVKTETKTDVMPEAMPDSAAMMQAWQNFMTPGDKHKWMEETNGTWEAEVSQWMDPSAPPTKVKATLVQSSTLGGRYVVGKYSSTMMGMPMEGISTMGYDNARKLYVSTWIDNLGTGIVHMTGTFDDATKTLNLKGFQTDPMTGKDSEIREELTIIDKDSYTMSMFGTGFDGKEMKFMEGTYKRKK